MDIFHKKERQQLVSVVVALSVVIALMAIVLGYFIWHDSARVCPDKECPEAVASNALTDTDGDGISDSVEKSIFKTNPEKSDTDGDGYFDLQELEGGYDPLVPASE